MRGCVKATTRNDSGVWQVSQALPSSALCTSAWQDAQAVDCPRKSITRAAPAPVPEAFLWHFAHASLACAPVRANRVPVAWSKVPRPNPVSLWQLLQSCLNAPRCGSWWHVAQRSNLSATCDRRFRVALRTGHLRVLALQGEGRPPVIDLLRLPRVAVVARRACVAHRLPMRTLVAVCALGEPQPFEDLVDVALRARHRAVGARQLEGRLRMIEAGPRLLERHVRRVAGAAIRPEARLVDVGVARRACRRQREKRPRLVALGAVPGDGRVAAVQREPGFGRVVEGAWLERPQLGVDAGVLDVAGGAVSRDVPVNALLRPDPVPDRLVAGEAQVGRDLAAGLMALLAVVGAFERCVGARERAGGEQLPDLRTRGRGPGQDAHGEHECRESPGSNPESRVSNTGCPYHHTYPR